MQHVRYLAVARIGDKTSVAEHAFADGADIPKTFFDDKLARVLASGRVEEHGRLTITDKDVGNIHYDSDPACLYLGKFVSEDRRKLGADK
jgi:hypothetical protein